MAVSCAKLYLVETNWNHERLFSCAARNGKVEVLEWAQNSGHNFHMILHMYNYVAKKGHLNVVTFMRNLGMPWTDLTFANAAEDGNIDLLKWMKADGCPMGEMACANAAQSG
mgnify:CR=1 FL=1